MQIVGLAIVIISISSLLLSRDWRFSALSLSAHYAGIALLLADGFTIQTVLVELVLCFTTAALAWFAVPNEARSDESRESRVEERGSVRSRLSTLDSRPGRGEPNAPPLSAFFQFLTLVLCGFAALGLSSSYPIAVSGTASNLNFAFYWLVAVGMLALGVSRSPLSIGAGLLFFLEAVQIAYLARTEIAQPGASFGLMAVQIILILVIVRFAGIHRPTRLDGWNGPLHLLTILLAVSALLAVLVLAADVFLSSIILTGMALLLALLCQGTRQEERQEAARGLETMKLVALATIAGACLQIAIILAGEFQMAREPLLARVVVGLVAIGFASLVGAFPFHWWLLELPRRTNPLATGVAVGALGLGALAFLLQMIGAYPWLLSDPRSQATLMALGILGAGVAALIAVSQKKFASLAMYAVAGNAGIAIAGIAANTQQGLVGAVLLLLNQALGVLLLFLSFGAMTREGQAPILTIGNVSGPAPILTAGNVSGQATAHLGIEELASRAREHPFAALGIVLGSLTLLGVPPFAGFLGRWLVFVEVSRQSTHLLVIAVAASALSLFSFVPVFQRLLAGLGIDGIPRQDPTILRGTILVLALMPLVIGFYPSPILQAIADLLKGFPIE